MLASVGKMFVLALFFASSHWVLADDLPINDQLNNAELTLSGLEERAEEAMRQIAQEDKPHFKIAAFSSDMGKQAQELKAIESFELINKAISNQKQRLEENKMLSQTVRTAAGASLVKSTKRLEELRHRAGVLQARLEELEKAADQWGADFAQMHSIDEKEALIGLRKSIESELRAYEPKGSKKDFPKGSNAIEQIGGSPEKVVLNNVVVDQDGTSQGKNAEEKTAVSLSIPKTPADENSPKKQPRNLYQEELNRVKGGLGVRSDLPQPAKPIYTHSSNDITRPKITQRAVYEAAKRNTGFSALEQRLNTSYDRLFRILSSDGSQELRENHQRWVDDVFSRAVSDAQRTQTSAQGSGVPISQECIELLISALSSRIKDIDQCYGRIQAYR